MAKYSSIVILTGAGISADSGVPTFRGPDGLWEGHRVEDVATPEAFARDPVLVQRFYDARRAALSRVEPNPAHYALAHLDREFGGDLLIVTQNVDDLHERAGAKRLLHMHGELKRALCLECRESHPWNSTLIDNPACPGCGEARLRPDIVWFGEMPYEMDRIEAALADCDLFVSIGTSGAVYPAAGFVQTARYYGRAHCVELNLDRSAGTGWFHEARHGRASEIVPQWVDEVLA